VILTRQETHDLLADLERVRKQLAPATLRLLRQLEDAYQLMSTYTLSEIHVSVKREANRLEAALNAIKPKEARALVSHSSPAVRGAVGRKRP
jgi:hypothetical protein